MKLKIDYDENELFTCKVEFSIARYLLWWVLDNSIFHLRGAYDERCGRSKEVRTPELIGQIKNFMDKDRRVSIETISAQFDVSVGTVHTIIREELKMRKICTKFFSRLLILVTVYLTKMGMKTVPHPAYSPHLAPCDF